MNNNEIYILKNWYYLSKQLIHLIQILHLLFFFNSLILKFRIEPKPNNKSSP